jgi:hypothetical protein
MRQKAAIYPQKIFRGRISRRFLWVKRSLVTGRIEVGGTMYLEIAMEKAAKKMQAVFRWNVILKKMKRRLRAMKEIKLLLMVLKVQRTFKKQRAMKQTLKALKKKKNMTKAELQVRVGSNDRGRAAGGYR